jgi:hypothetical protein
LSRINRDIARDEFDFKSPKHAGVRAFHSRRKFHASQATPASGDGAHPDVVALGANELAVELSRNGDTSFPPVKLIERHDMLFQPSQTLRSAEVCIFAIVFVFVSPEVEIDRILEFNRRIDCVLETSADITTIQD